MNNYSQSSDEFILQYLDGQVPMKDKTEFENALKANSELNQRFQQLKMVHDVLNAGRLESPDPEFTSKVMRNLNQAQTRLVMSPKNGLMLLLGVGIALMLGVVYLYTGTFDQISGVIDLETVKLPKSIIQRSLPAIPFNASMVMKILVGLNLAIAFVLIDRTILQPYFRNRSARHS
jgi:anti-sigma factor RsiW